MDYTAAKLCGKNFSFSNHGTCMRDRKFILAVMKLFPINVDFSQNHLLTMPKVLKSCLTLLFTTCPKAW
jgi:hypothetical protein